MTFLALLLCVLSGCIARQELGRSDPPPDRRWVPEIGLSWQIQLQGDIDTTVDAEVYDVDLFDVEISVVKELRRDGRKVICYVNVGAYEQWRSDAHDFPSEVVGASVPGWPGESWLDIRRLDVLEPIMAARLDLCQQKGFDGVDPDNLDVFSQNAGFDLTAEDQLRYNRMIARLAHERLLSVGLKNDLEQASQLVDEFDFAVNESCAIQEECNLLQPFINAGKPVFHIEYEMSVGEFCPMTAALQFSSIRKPRDLTAAREPCPKP